MEPGICTWQFVDAGQKRTPHLVPYAQVDERIKEANREAAAENIRTLQLFGIFLEAPVMERDLEAEKELRALQALTRTFRAEATFKNLIICKILAMGEHKPHTPIGRGGGRGLDLLMGNLMLKLNDNQTVSR